MNPYPCFNAPDCKRLVRCPKDSLPNPPLYCKPCRRSQSQCSIKG